MIGSTIKHIVSIRIYKGYSVDCAWSPKVLSNRLENFSKHMLALTLLVTRSAK